MEEPINLFLSFQSDIFPNFVIDRAVLGVSIPEIFDRSLPM